MPIATYRKHASRVLTRATRASRSLLVDKTPGPLRRWLAPVGLHADMLFVDHGIFRVAYLNRHQLGPDAQRAAQPTPGQVRRLANRGLKTIINLRGVRQCGSFWLEQRACEKHGVELVNFTVRSRGAPTRNEVHGAKKIFDEISYPMLLHCKSGADRAGLMSVLYMHIRGGLPIEEARAQLALRFGHIRQAKTGILDAFFDQYVDYNAKTPISFFEWVDTVYDPQALIDSFESRSWADRLVDGILRRE
ncbi:MAG: tyrosine-protein phosphatase [Pseudomonadota bacterium]